MSKHREPKTCIIAGTLIEHHQIMTIFRKLSFTGKQALIELTEKGQNTKPIIEKMEKEIKSIKQKAKEINKNYDELQNPKSNRKP